MKTVRKRLSDGTIKVYRYPRVRYETEEAAGNAVRQIAIRFYDSPEFKGASRSWQLAIRYYVGLIEEELGWMTAGDLNDRKARGEFYALRDKHADTPIKADKIMSVLRRLLAWAYDRTILDANHATGIPRLARGSRRDIVWTLEAENALLLTSAPEIANLYYMALYSGARLSDVIRFRWDQFDGKWLVFTPGKTAKSTGVTVHLPVYALPPFAAFLESLPRQHERMLTTRLGRPWAYANVQLRWRTAFRAAGLSGLHYHDIRGTTSSRLSNAGCTEAEIAAISGHRMAGGSLNAYVARSKELAVRAYTKWAAEMAAPTVVAFPGNRAGNQGK